MIFFRIYEPLNCILDICSEDSKNKFFLAYSELHELMQSSPGSRSVEINDHIKEVIKTYGTNMAQKNDEIEYVAKASDIILKNYSSYFNQESQNLCYSANIFFLFVKVRRFPDFFQL